jgi:hypothetical protein
MISAAKKIFIPPVFDDEEKNQQAYFLYIIVWVLIFIPLLYVVYILINVPEDASRAITQGVGG